MRTPFACAQAALLLAVGCLAQQQPAGAELDADAGTPPLLLGHAALAARTAAEREARRLTLQTSSAGSSSGSLSSARHQRRSFIAASLDSDDDGLLVGGPSAARHVPGEHGHAHARRAAARRRALLAQATAAAAAADAAQPQSLAGVPPLPPLLFARHLLDEHGVLALHAAWHGDDALLAERDVDPAAAWLLDAVVKEAQPLAEGSTAMQQQADAAQELWDKHNSQPQAQPEQQDNDSEAKPDEQDASPPPDQHSAAPEPELGPPADAPDAPPPESSPSPSTAAGTPPPLQTTSVPASSKPAAPAILIAQEDDEDSEADAEGGDEDGEAVQGQDGSAEDGQDGQDASGEDGGDANGQDASGADGEDVEDQDDEPQETDEDAGTWPPPAVRVISMDQRVAASTAASTSRTAAPTAKASPWPRGSKDAGKTWKLSPDFKDFSEFKILRWSSGQDNSQVLRKGLPPYAYAKPANSGGTKAQGVTSGSGATPISAPVQDGGDASSSESCAANGQDEEDEEEEEPEETQDTSPAPAAGGVGDLLGGLLGSILTRRSPLHGVSPAPQRRQIEALDKPIGSVFGVTAAQGKSVIETYYPAGSSNPGGTPVGGSQFYALSPFDLRPALTVTLAYDVFVPASFEYIQGGKLPGLYGGREECSGGDEAADCWSARFMWRTDGEGEVYLYVPQDRQDPSICNVPPKSVCDSSYGVSLGRGSFHFTRGAWTSLSQTIFLGSGTKPDGSIRVSANGKQVLSFNKILYPSAHKGLFFSTFFGGHGPDWATKKNQALYFRNFSIKVEK